MLEKLPQRKNNRLPKYDYSSPGFYFVTISTKNNYNYFGYIRNGIMCLNECGSLVWQQWRWLERYPYIDLDEFIVMPNHVHGILIIKDFASGTDKSRFVRTKNEEIKIKSLSELIGAFKSTSSKLIHAHGLIEFDWHRSFYDHIIENQRDLDRIRKYICYNSLNVRDA